MIAHAPRPALAARFLAALLLAPAALARQTATPAPSRAQYAEFALAHDGDPARGRAVFTSDPRVACANCHSVDGSASKAGPDLASVGDKFPRRELVRALLEPSAAIAVGYAATLVETRSGETVQGVLKQSTGDWIELKGADGKAVRVARADIASQRVLEASLMPEGLEAGMTLQGFADLVAYLASLRQATGGLAAAPGMPARIPVAARPAALSPFFSGGVRFERPLWCGVVPGAPGRFVVLEHGGRSWIVTRDPAGDRREPFLDLSGTVRVGGATGLLGLAFHPRFPEDPRYFLVYQVVEDGRIVTHLAERRFAPDGRGDAGGPARVLLRIPAATQDHNGGAIGFGPDGFLYVGMGDTGPQRDPQGHGQDLALWLGKILRIDVDRRDPGRGYAIPSDNPFRDVPGARPEIWALGFREPWRLSFDRATGDLWVGDVGQDRIEEIGIVRAGENHGWNVFEGFEPFSDRYRRPEAKYVPPVFAYPHRVGVSITAGHVYRGTRAPRMAGWHVCGDFESRRILALTQTNRVLRDVVQVGVAPSRIASFAEDASGELLLVGYDSGLVYRVDLSAADPAPMESRVVAATSEQGPVAWRTTERAPAEGWTAPGFDDGGWAEGPGGFGTAGTPGAVVRTEWRTADLWLRRGFEIPAGGVPAAGALMLRVHHDEDAEVYLNGVEAARLPRWTQGYEDVPVRPEAAAALRAGRNVIAVHCHQVSGGQYVDAGLVEWVQPGGAGAARAAK